MSADWGDLGPRVLSGLGMILVGGLAVWVGGAPFALLVVLVTGGMMWELARMTADPARDLSLWLGALAAGMLALNLWSASPWPLAALALPAVAGALLPRRDRAVFFAYALVIMATGLSLVILRQSLGLVPVLWVLAVVVASDVLGYFAGRSLGGPKFWPRVSPKKTWSGTAAGWVGAALVGLGFWAAGLGTSHLLWASPLLAFAGQMGDIAESAIKRRAGVKDSSRLIPGHGGLLDRFDGLAFAAILSVLLQVAVPLFPLVKG
ncbi:phosphatidate cytidylyltransferase [Tabrizicola oligotrophica]|uniref:Phosphatidate cytidylyltransferase n=1 Tax=Tabrizicola oligotrophica TaxID=2710650 RepID=A0A6M0QQT4_9RHOB|nr:phosphatidate cytidylyltransferase [Tabrizicola oligotrophica]NEY88742.1 phosphatidate cytidylyltransferase [Tabrizicola oligotrophica]